MGVQDFRCSVCGTPSSYKCGEKAGTRCVREGLGNDEAILDLFFFTADEAPESPEAFEAARTRARRTETRPFGYDWGEWEFVPSLNYRQLLMKDEDSTGIWLIQPFDEDLGDGSPVSLEIPQDERVWVVNYCTPCRALFVDQMSSDKEPCKEYLAAVAKQLELDFDSKRKGAPKAPFIEAVRERVARRRP